MKTTFKIGKLTRTLNILAYEWGVRVISEDKSKNFNKSYFDARNFKLTKNYPTIEKNIKRGMRYFKAPQEIIEKTILW